MIARHFAAIVLSLVAVSQSLAWNNLGHKVVAEIAWRQLDSATKQSIVDTLRRHPRFDTDFVAKMEDSAASGDKATQDHWIFQHAATWPDLARSLPAGERGKYDRPLWHYINLPMFLNPADRAGVNLRAVNLAADYTLNEDKKQFNILQALKYCRAALHGNSDQQTKALAYCWLFHLVGDIHQPLHTTALFDAEHFPKGDKGGNDIPLVRGKNLHALWDGLLGTQYYMRNVTKAANALGKRDLYGDVLDSAGKETDPRKWAEESHKLCETMVYDPAILEAVRKLGLGEKLAPIELPETYRTDAGEQARKRIVAAGVRLANMLRDKVSNAH